MKRWWMHPPLSVKETPGFVDLKAMIDSAEIETMAAAVDRERWLDKWTDGQCKRVLRHERKQAQKAIRAYRLFIAWDKLKKRFGIKTSCE